MKRSSLVPLSASTADVAPNQPSASTVPATSAEPPFSRNVSQVHSMRDAFPTAILELGLSKVAQ